MTSASRASVLAWLCVLLMPSVCLLVPTSAHARLISEDSTSPGFPSDPAFATGSLLIPLDNLALSPGDRSFSITVGGTQFHFETLSSHGLGGRVLQTFDLPVVLTITPPVPVVGLIVTNAECGGRATFVGSLGTEVGEGNYGRFLGAAEIGDISTVTLEDRCADGSSWPSLRFVPGGAGQADLVASKTSNPAVVGAQAPLSYSIDVANVGRDAARNATAVDFLPPGVTIQSTSPGATLRPPVVNWSLGDLAPGASQSVSLLVTTPPFETFSCEDTLLNLAETTTSTGESTLRNNFAFTTTRFDKASRAGQPENCNNHIDDNCDGFVDCNDPACLGTCNAAVSAAITPVPVAPDDATAALWWIRYVIPTPGACIGFLGGTQLEPVCCDPHQVFLSCGGLFPNDPNFKEANPPTNVFGYGHAAAGQAITYTIHYENIGTGDAHDVSILDPLHPRLDETTLLINNDGGYDPATRVIVWRDPVPLPPHVPRSVGFSVKIRADAQPGTRVRNRATIIFPEAASPRTDTNFVEHTIVDPRFPIVADLSIDGCTSAGSSQWKVSLVNRGFGFAYNVTAEIVNPPALFQVSDASARFGHPDDLRPDLLATVMPLSRLTSADTVTITRSHGRKSKDGEDDDEDDRHETSHSQITHDPCGVLTWRIRYTTSTGETLSKVVRPSIPGLCPCDGPAAGGTWKTHGAYESCVVHAAGEFVQAGLISGRQKDAIVTAAAHSSCGKHNRSGEEGEEDDREAEERRR
jgi:uncharacterized repeat protein (TIGR01451 family)